MPLGFSSSLIGDQPQPTTAGAPREAQAIRFLYPGERDVLSDAEPRTTIIYNNLALLLRWFYGLRIDCSATPPAL